MEVLNCINECILTHVVKRVCFIVFLLIEFKKTQKLISFYNIFYVRVGLKWDLYFFGVYASIRLKIYINDIIEQFCSIKQLKVNMKVMFVSLSV